MPLDPTTRGILLFAIVALALLWTVWYGRQRSHRVAKKEAGLSNAGLDQRQRLQRAMEQLQVNLMEFGRDVEGRLDTKISALSTLIHDADERIKTLQDLSKSPHARNSDDVPPLHKEIFRLADEGLDKLEIARRTQSTPGEVELILALRKNRNA